jgi:hypothetical protein
VSDDEAGNICRALLLGAMVVASRELGAHGLAAEAYTRPLYSST